MLIANAQNLEPTEPSEHEASRDLPGDAASLAHADEAPEQRPPWAGNADRTWLDVIAAPRIAIPILLGMGLVLFIANLGGYPLYTKGEPREAVIVADMLRGGGVILPMRAGVEIPSKPPMMHWMAAALSVIVGGVDEWTVRMPSAALAILGIIACYLYVRRLFDDRSAMLSAMMLGTTFQYLQAGTGARVGTVDKFQGQEAPVVIYSMATSRPEDAPRGMEFLYSLNRLNVATSRARCVAILVASPRLFEVECLSPRQMKLANGLCRFREMATPVAAER